MTPSASDIGAELRKLRGQVPTPVRQGIRQATTTFGTATAGARMLPDFIVVGAQRSGTTTLYRLLTDHPALVRPAFMKGIRYFDLNYHRGWNWYRGHFPVAPTAHLRTMRTGTPATFEMSGYYMFHPLAPERMARDLPQVRIVAMLRDPVDRAYSAHRHELERGFETEPFERALELEPARLKGEVEHMRADPLYQSFAHQHQAYLTRGHYADQIKELAAQVGRDRIHLIDANKFFDDPHGEFARLQQWLGLPMWQPPGVGRHNARPREDMDDALRERLREVFVEPDRELEEWLGEVPSWRLS